MREILGVTQESPQTQRRWFHHDFFDLFVSQASGGTVDGFQLCYGPDGLERALVWDRERGYFHDGTNLLDAGDIAQRFEAVAHELPAELARELAERLREFATQGSAAPARRRRYRRADWQQRQA